MLFMNSVSLHGYLRDIIVISGTVSTNMADNKQVQTECSVETFLNITNSSKLSNCEKCADLKLQLSQALNELSSDQLIVDFLNKEYNYKQNEQTFNKVRNDFWTQVTSNYQKKA